jgi:hypothetical protein
MKLVPSFYLIRAATHPEAETTAAIKSRRCLKTMFTANLASSATNAVTPKTNSCVPSSDQRIPMHKDSPDSEQELRWRGWQEKGRLADRLADRRMNVMFTLVGLILLAWILYCAFRPKVSRDVDRVQNAMRCDHIFNLSPSNLPVNRPRSLAAVACRTSGRPTAQIPPVLGVFVRRAPYQTVQATFP